MSLEFLTQLVWLILLQCVTNDQHISHRCLYTGPDHILVTFQIVILISLHKGFFSLGSAHFFNASNDIVVLVDLEVPLFVAF